MDNLPVNILDIGALLILVISAFLAYGRGLVHEALAVGGWIGAIFVTLYGYPYLLPVVSDVIKVELVDAIVTGAVLFVGSLIVLSLLTHRLAKGVRDSALNMLDRSLGFLFGLLRGAIIVCLLWIAYDSLAADETGPPDWVRDARSLPLIVAGADTLKNLVPEDLAAQGQDAVDQAREQADQAIEERIEEEKEKVLQQMIDPKTAPPAGSFPGYGERERKALERLIQSNQ